MYLTEALQIMQHSLTENSRRPMKLVLVVNRPGQMGGTPYVEVESICAGFDWDAGKMMIFPSRSVTELSPAEIEAIRKSAAAGQSWHAYQAHKKHQEQLKAVEAERDTWEQRACNEAARVVELEQKLAAAEALVAARIEQIPVESKMVAVFADLMPEHQAQAEELTEAIKKRCTSGRWTLVAFLRPEASIQALDAAAMEAAGWVRAPKS